MGLQCRCPGDTAVLSFEGAATIFLPELKTHLPKLSPQQCDCRGGFFICAGHAVAARAAAVPCPHAKAYHEPTTMRWYISLDPRQVPGTDCSGARKPMRGRNASQGHMGAEGPPQTCHWRPLRERGLRRHQPWAMHQEYAPASPQRGAWHMQWSAPWGLPHPQRGPPNSGLPWRTLVARGGGKKVCARGVGVVGAHSPPPSWLP